MTIMIGMDIIAGNAFSLFAMVSDSISGTRKKNHQILALQSLSQVFYGVGSIILKGYSSTAQNVVAILRNFAAMKGIRNRAMEWTLVAMGVVLGMLFNNRGLLGWLPIVANLEYSIAIFRFRDREKPLKIAFIINMLMYSVFSVVIRNYVGIVSNLVVAATTFVSLVREAPRGETETGE